MGPADTRAALRISVAFSPGPGAVDAVDLTLPEGSTVADALRASGLAGPGAPAERAGLKAAVWGVVRPMEQALRDRDRVELLRPLKVDPKEARRLRYRAQRAVK